MLALLVMLFFSCGLFSDENRTVSFNKNGENRIGHIVIDDRTSGISQSTWIYVKNALEYYQHNKPIFVILELNTPGGEVFAAQKISDSLKELDTQYGIPVVAFINNWAISAGAMLAYSSRYIATVKDGAMGAAEPVLQGEGGKTEAASEKVNSAIRTDFMNRARFFDRNPYIAEAMVDKDVILVKRNGSIIKLEYESQIKQEGPDKDIIISPKGKLLTLSAEEMINYGVADFMILPKRLEPLTDKEKETGIYPASKSPLFQSLPFSQIPEAIIDTYHMDWKTRVFVILSNPVVSSLLLLGVMVGFYMEFSTPGFGFPGTVAVTSLFLLVLSSFSQEIGSFLEVILLFTGLAVILAEIFVLPSFGLLGIIGVIFFLAGLLGLMIPGISNVQFEFDTQTWNAAGEVVLQRVVWLAATFLIGGAIIAILARYMMPHFSGFKKFVLEGHEQVGYTAGEDPKNFPQPGSQGKVYASLRPAGKIEIEGRIFEAISTGGFIEQGEAVEIIRLEGSQLIVRRKDL